VHAARDGSRTLLVSADGGLGDVLGHPTGPEPTEVEPGLFAVRTDSAAEFREEARGLQQRLAIALDIFAVTPFDDEELTELPGSPEVALLRVLRERAGGHPRFGTDTGTGSSGDDAGTEPATGTRRGTGRRRPSSGGEAAWDLVVVDCPPTHAALAALALPEQARRYLGRVLPAERQAARALRPVLATLTGVPMPADWLYAAADRTAGELAAAQAVIEDDATTVRLVVEPGPLAAAELRRARAGLALFGHRLEAVLANRVLPTGSADPWLAERAGRQQQELKALHEQGADGGWAVLELPHLGHDPVGPDALAAIGGRLDVPPRPTRPAPEPWTVEDVGPDGIADAEFVWRLPLPGAERGDLDLVRRGDELVIDVFRHRRIVPLPSALRRCRVSGAALGDGELRVRFVPDPEVWPTA
jgi:arsenite/tail-anchored protein-transporting ATPase